MIARAQLIDLLFVIAPHSLLLDIAGPAEAFRLANLHRQARGQPPRFRLRFAGPMAGPPTSVGLTLANLEPLPELIGRAIVISLYELLIFGPVFLLALCIRRMRARQQPTQPQESSA